LKKVLIPSFLHRSNPTPIENALKEAEVQKKADQDALDLKLIQEKEQEALTKQQNEASLKSQQDEEKKKKKKADAKKRKRDNKKKNNQAKKLEIQKQVTTILINWFHMFFIGI
jgi:hypothetical protein